MALRVKYADYPGEAIQVLDSLEEGIRQALSLDAQVTYILCTYTALIPCRRILQKLARNGGIQVKAGERQDD